VVVDRVTTRQLKEQSPPPTTKTTPPAKALVKVETYDDVDGIVPF